MLHQQFEDSSLLRLLPADPLARRLTSIFSHPWNSILRDVAESTWQTESGYFLQPRVLWERWKDQTCFVGVRFGQSTTYALLDIDIESPYHLENNSAALPRLVRSLEAIGIYRTLLIQSSDSRGLHLYLPLESPVETYGLAVALKHCLEGAGFNLAPGCLESFPNCKSYAIGSYTDYHGHRLPLQAGSYLLNHAGDVLSADLEHFLRAWDLAAGGNEVMELRQAIALAKRNQKAQVARSKGRSATQWQRDDEVVIATGWTGPHQTNEFLKIVARHGVVFKDLRDEALVAYMMDTAINAPGYEQFCGHQHDIERRCRDWAKEAQKYYRPYPSHPRQGNLWRGNPPNLKANRNIQVGNDAIARIKQAVGTLATGLTTTIRDLANTIASAARCSLATLYKHLNLWHPEHRESNGCNEPLEGNLSDTEQPIENPLESLKPSSGGLLHPKASKKVLNAVTPRSTIGHHREMGKNPTITPHRAPSSDRAPAVAPDIPPIKNPLDWLVEGNLGDSS